MVVAVAAERVRDEKDDRAYKGIRGMEYLKGEVTYKVWWDKALTPEQIRSLYEYPHQIFLKVDESIKND